MNKKKLLGVALSAALAFSFSASPANADSLILEEGACVLTLPDRVIRDSGEFDYYQTGLKDSNYVFKTTLITSEMLVCPTGVTADVSDSNLFRTPLGNNWQFELVSSSSPTAFANFEWAEDAVIDATTKETSFKRGWIILGEAATYDSIFARGVAQKPYIRANDDKFYELKLAKAFQLVSGITLSSSACVITIPDTTRYYSDPENKNFVTFPVSNLKCPADIAGHRIGFDIDVMNSEGETNWIGSNCSDEDNKQKVDSATSLVYEPADLLCTYAATMGVVTKTTNSSYVYDYASGIWYPVVLAAPFKSKKATDVTAKVKKKGSILTIKIHADRNDWFNNENNVGSHKRQTVIAKDKADRAIVKRGNKVIATVKLSIYGNGTVKIKDIAGKNNYTVTLVETDLNHAGVASFKK
jgi:hypothetical protein